MDMVNPFSKMPEVRFSATGQAGPGLQELST